jgi:deoxyribodipyrimidine photo-lyase
MKRSLCWLRRDLRLHDNHALSEALTAAEQCFIVFIFDEIILDKIANKNDLRLSLIFDSLREIELELKKHGSDLIVLFGDPVIEIPKIILEYKIDALFFNRDYEPYAKQRDHEVVKILQTKHVNSFAFKDSVFYESREILNGSGEIYKVFTPYKNKWLEKFRSEEEYIPDHKTIFSKLAQFTFTKSLVDYDWYQTIGFLETTCCIKGGTKEAHKKLKLFDQYISNYNLARDVPSLDETSGLSPYIRFGNISIREMVRFSLKKNSLGNQTWLSELIWRDFYQMILDAYPQVEKNCFRPEYDQIKWLGSQSDFNSWCDGLTGYPLVDSAMRCLNATGLMHNRLRMVVASFLTKTLLIDWRQGENYFATRLLDYDLAANNGGWQWSASTGVDAQPYFRIFNPYNQSRKFDPKGIFIRQWCPELKDFNDKEIHAPHETEIDEQTMAGCFIGQDYPHPIVAYREQRDRALKMYKSILKPHQ